MSDRRTWKRRVTWATLGSLVALCACSLLVDNFTECHVDTDCGSRTTDGGAFQYLCQAGYCLPLDARCTVIGPPLGDAIIFGAIFPKTNTDGSPHQWGPSWERAVKLIVDELNPPNRTGIRGKPIRVYSCDSRSSNDGAAELASYLIGRGAQVIIADGSAETIAESRVTIPAGVLLISGAATSPEITFLADSAPDGGTGLVWRTTPSDVIQAPVMAREIRGDGGTFPKVAVLTRDDAYGQGLAAAFSRNYQSADGGETHRIIYFNATSDPSITNALVQADAYHPEVMAVIGFPAEVVKLINGSANRSGLQSASWFFTQGAKFPGLFTSVDGGVPIEGARGTAPSAGYSNSEPTLYFRTRYQQLYNERWDSVVDLANVYDATYLAALAADYSLGKVQRLDGTVMAQALTQVSTGGGQQVSLVPFRFNEASDALNAGQPLNVEGASGHLDFDPATGEAPADIDVWMIEGNQFVTVKTVSP